MGNNFLDMQSAVLREQLVELRTRSQLTQHELAVQLGKPQSYVSKYEGGERKLTIIEIRNIAICCGSNLGDFVSSFEEELILAEKIR